MLRAIILISSNTGPQSGKSTVQEFILRHCPIMAERLAFADPMKAMVQEFLHQWFEDDPQVSQIHDMLFGDLKEVPLLDLGHDNQLVTPRRLMQTLGTEWRELFDRDVWRKILSRKVTKFRRQWGLMGEDGIIVIDDARFVREFQWMKDHHGGTPTFHVRVTRPGQSSSAGHSSEGELNNHPVDYTVVNSAGLGFLEEQVISIVEDILLRTKLTSGKSPSP